MDLMNLFNPMKVCILQVIVQREHLVHLGQLIHELVKHCKLVIMCPHCTYIHKHCVIALAQVCTPS